MELPERQNVRQGSAAEAIAVSAPSAAAAEKDDDPQAVIAKPASAAASAPAAAAAVIAAAAAAAAQDEDQKDQIASASAAYFTCTCDAYVYRFGCFHERIKMPFRTVRETGFYRFTPPVRVLSVHSCISGFRDQIKLRTAEPAVIS